MIEHTLITYVHIVQLNKNCVFQAFPNLGSCFNSNPSDRMGDNLREWAIYMFICVIH